MYWLCVFDGLTKRVWGGTKRREKGKIEGEGEEQEEKKKGQRKLSLHYYN